MNYLKNMVENLLIKFYRSRNKKIRKAEMDELGKRVLDLAECPGNINLTESLEKVMVESSESPGNYTIKADMKNKANKVY